MQLPTHAWLWYIQPAILHKTMASISSKLLTQFLVHFFMHLSYFLHAQTVRNTFASFVTFISGDPSARFPNPYYQIPFKIPCNINTSTYLFLFHQEHHDENSRGKESKSSPSKICQKRKVEKQKPLEFYYLCIL